MYGKVKHVPNHPPVFVATTVYHQGRPVTISSTITDGAAEAEAFSSTCRWKSMEHLKSGEHPWTSNKKFMCNIYIYIYITCTVCINYIEKKHNSHYRKRTSVCIHIYIYIYKKCIHIYISIIYRCTPRWQTSIGHSFQNAMDNHGFFGGGCGEPNMPCSRWIAWNNKARKPWLVTLAKWREAS